MVSKGGEDASIAISMKTPNPHATLFGSMSDKSPPTALSSELDLDIDSNSDRPQDPSDSKLLLAPFSKSKALVREPPLLPATVHAHHGRNMLLLSKSSPNITPSPLSAYIRNELNVSRLNSIHRHLWLAGLPRPARALHRQELIGRHVVVTEQTDLHLCWYKTRIFVKPLPSFLLHYDSWAALGHDKALYAEACGLLISYTWLVSRESDLKRALGMGLLPKHVNWESWTSFVADFLQHIDMRDHGAINQRYHYGELRIARLNTIFRVQGAREFKFRKLRQGFMTEPDWYSRFLRENFGWLVVVFGYIAIVLNAMQVGLNTTYLAGNVYYQKVAYGFSTFAIAMPVVMFACILFVSVGVVWYNVAGTLRYVGRFERAMRGDRWDRGEGLESNGDGDGAGASVLGANGGLRERGKVRGEKDAGYGG